MKNLFDIDDITDIPDDLKKEIRPLRLRANTDLLLSLFEIKNQLTFDEIIVAMKRKYNIKIKRTWLTSTFYNLKKRNLIKEVNGHKKTFERG